MSPRVPVLLPWMRLMTPAVNRTLRPCASKRQMPPSRSRTLNPRSRLRLSSNPSMKSLKSQTSISYQRSRPPRRSLPSVSLSPVQPLFPRLLIRPASQSLRFRSNIRLMLLPKSRPLNLRPPWTLPPNHRHKMTQVTVEQIVEEQGLVHFVAHYCTSR
ncbi:hypothetical protein BCR44DRAFT_1291462 [Catenaria anguillulae PL171]|uniref:Uncharacterized protein n=1 Tax=Catenaria anguillulae PL171 TaxID=765915 RepID=A0A1Y2H7V7_9FUNG|nr:hypothetical protein BCR44DRAFT_1291462 [Catenaria anguillulae PL171]